MPKTATQHHDSETETRTIGFVVYRYRGTRHPAYCKMEVSYVLDDSERGFHITACKWIEYGDGGPAQVWDSEMDDLGNQIAKQVEVTS